MTTFSDPKVIELDEAPAFDRPPADGHICVVVDGDEQRHVDCGPCGSKIMINRADDDGGYDLEPLGAGYCRECSEPFCPECRWNDDRCSRCVNSKEKAAYYDVTGAITARLFDLLTPESQIPELLESYRKALLTFGATAVEADRSVGLLSGQLQRDRGQRRQAQGAA